MFEQYLTHPNSQLRKLVKALIENKIIFENFSLCIDLGPHFTGVIIKTQKENIFILECTSYKKNKYPLMSFQPSKGIEKLPQDPYHSVYIDTITQSVELGDYPLKEIISILMNF